MAMIQKYNTSDGAHWYDANGFPKHWLTVDGKRRNTRITDARKLKLLPSVTSVIRVIAKKGLQDWINEQMVWAGLRLKVSGNERAMIDSFISAVGQAPKRSDEQLYEILQRGCSMGSARNRETSDLGKKVHKALEMALNGGNPNKEMDKYIEPVVAWIKEKQLNITHREARLVNLSEGYAGTADVLFAHGERTVGIIDYKTSLRVDRRMYTGEGEQIAAYAVAAFGLEKLPDVVGANIVISTMSPGEFRVHKHKDLKRLYEGFASMCAVWRYLNKYDPRR